MKKFILFISIVFLSLFLVNNKVYAQGYHDGLIKIPYSEFYFERTNQYTYEFTVEYLIYDVYITEHELDDTYLFITNHYIKFRKGLDIVYDSYVLEDIYAWIDQFSMGTLFTLRVTVDKRLIDDYYGEDVLPFFRDNSALYVNYRISTVPSDYYRGYNDGYENGYSEGYDDGLQVGEQVGYDNGYSTGYDNGYNNGYNEGYGDGVRATEPQAYQRGYDDGYNKASNHAPIKFLSNIQVWLVPAIIIVVIAGIFVGYRRERHWND